jgi:Rieske Fe-S protein
MKKYPFPNIIKKIASATFLIICCFACENDNSSNFPYVTVNYQLNIATDLYNIGVGEYVTITAAKNNAEYSVINYYNSKIQNKYIAQKTYGNGIILYRKDFYEYQAFDMTCTYRPSEEYCQLKVDKDNNYIFVCPCCSSQFVITSDGVTVKGSKALMPLAQYNTRIDNNVLIISNE